ncbi:MAG: proteasome subunit beta [Nitrospinae bacterium]|nr:proteasome subunit beta [Nitrospinota bacterium]
MQLPTQYQGSSFWELLKTDTPDLVPSILLEPGAELPPSQPHGTTILALKVADGVVMVGDRMATEGFHVSDRRIEKVFKADGSTLIAIAGVAGPCLEAVRLFQTELEHYEKIEGEQLVLEGKANKLAQMVRANLPSALQGLIVIPILAGYDDRSEVGRIFKYDLTGGRYEEDDYHATGSGGREAKAALKKLYREELPTDEGIRIGLEALMDAADEDVGTGGPDISRGIFPTVKVISGEGIHEVPEDEVRPIIETLTAARQKS